MSQATDQCVKCERDLWEQANDAEIFSKIFADDAIAVMEPMGFVTKEQALEMVPEKPWAEVEMLDLTANEVSPECVILAYHGRAKSGDGKPYQASVCSTYLKRGDDWQVVLSAHQPWDPDQAQQG